MTAILVMNEWTSMYGVALFYWDVQWKEREGKHEIKKYYPLNLQMIHKLE